MDINTKLKTGLRARPCPDSSINLHLEPHLLDNSTSDRALSNGEKRGPVVSKQAQQSLKASTNVKRKKKRGLKLAAPAETVTRGFHTPTTSGGEESDVSTINTPKLRPLQQQSPSSKETPLTRDSSLTRAISALKLTGDHLGPENGANVADETGTSQSRLVFLDQSKNVINFPTTRDGNHGAEENRPRKIFGAIEGGLRHDSPHRKMEASDFEALKCLGKGAYGTVVLVRQRSTGRLFAQKQLKKASLTLQKRLVEQTKNERAILESVKRHPFVVKLFYAFQDQQKLYLILEYAQGGELFHHLALERTFTEEVAAFYMAEMVLALEHLHADLGVVYRDLKPENCLLDAEGHLLLTDFGLSKVALEDPTSSWSDSKCNSILGTIDYMAPEVVQGQPYDAAVDWWSLGALGFDLLTGSPPFSSNNHTKTQQKILYSKLALPYYLSPDAKDILTRLLRKDPKKRLGGNMPLDMKAIKGHRFFRKVDWSTLGNREVLAPIQPIITDPAAAENFATEFTELALSPMDLHARAGTPSYCLDMEYNDKTDVSWKDQSDDTFGGFSYVASRSLIEASALQ